MNKITNAELKERLRWSIYQKIDHTLGVIEQFQNYTNGKCYISFSGGKDSTVLLHLVRRFYPDTKAMFILTGNEYPEIVRFVRAFKNIDYVRPKITFKEVIKRYGFPFISKEQAQYIFEAKNTKSEKLRELRLNGRHEKGNQGKVSNKWKFMINAEFNVTHKCCHFLKKEPARRYETETGLMPIIGTMAMESSLRKQKYLKTSCNVLDGEKSASYPLSIWTDEDIWEYIRMFNLDYCPLYDIGYERTGCMVCGFGYQCDKNRFQKLELIHKKAFDTYMGYTNNGVRFDEAIKFTFEGKNNGLI